MAINYRSADLAKRLGIGPRTKNYTARDEDGLPAWDGDTAEQVLCGLKLAATGDMPLMLAAAGLLKALTTDPNQNWAEQATDAWTAAAREAGIEFEITSYEVPDVNNDAALISVHGDNYVLTVTDNGGQARTVEACAV